MVGEREVRVRLTADVDVYVRKLREASAATMVAGRNTDSLSNDLQRAESQAKKTGNEIDKLSGRLRLATDAALIFGPALAPLGAAAVGGIIALSAQLGAMAGALGVTLLAVNGLGDGLKALDAYQLEPTAENLKKLNQEMEKLGPAGANFVHYLDEIEPELSKLQMAARNGLLPGAEEGIDALLERLPELRRIIRATSEVMGDELADAGAALGGERFDKFFNYLKSDGIKILDDTARTIGSLTEAAANLFAAFGPLSGDFSGGLLEFSQGLADASRDLDSNPGLQEFMQYIEATGPQVLDTLGALANAVLQIVEAVAPLGGPVLKGVEAFADAIGAIADSDLGTPIFAALAAMALYTRAVSLAGTVGKSTFGQIAMGQKDVTAGFAKAGAQAKLFANDLQLVARYGTLATEQSARLTGQLKKYGPGAAAVAGLAFETSGLSDKMGVSNAASMAMMGTIAGPWGAAIGAAVGLTMDFTQANDALNTSLTNLDAVKATGDIAAYAEAISTARAELEDMQVGNDRGLFTALTMGGTELPELWSKISGATSDAEDKIAEAQKTLESMRNGTYRAVGTLGDFSRVLSDNAEAAENQAAALAAATNAMREQREETLKGLNAQLDYQQSLLNAADAIKENGKDFSKTTEAGIANRRALYGIAEAWNSQDDAAKNAKGSLESARQKFLDAADAMGATRAQAKRLADQLFEIPTKRPIDVYLDTHGADATLRALKARMDALKDRTVHVNVVSNVRPQGGQAPTDEQVAPGPKRTTARPRMSGRGALDISPADIYTSSRGALSVNGAKAAMYGRGNGDDPRNPGEKDDDKKARHRLQLYVDAADATGSALKIFKRLLEQASNAVDKEKTALENLTSARDSFASTVGGAYSGADLFSGSLSDFDSGVSANINDTNAAKAALAQAAKNGLNGPLYQALAASGNLTLLQEFAGLSASQIADREHQFATQSAAQTGLGSQAANHEFAQAIKDQTKELREAQRERKQLAEQVKQLGKKVEEGAEKGTRAGMNDRDRRTASRVRTG